MRPVVWWKVKDDALLWLALAFTIPVLLGAAWITIAFLCHL